MPDPRDASISQLLSKMVCVFADRPEFVVITMHAVDGGATYTIQAHPDDTGKIIGKQGHNAKSLRTIVSAVGQKLQRRYVLVFDEKI
jgi:predicted RNA-binding protein YlqC (UPF0109 family)